jgi:hypothetical protein
MTSSNLALAVGCACVGALGLAACEGSVSMSSRQPVWPSAASGPWLGANADGSTMKVTAPIGVFPLPDSTGIPVEVILTALPAKAKYAAGATVAASFSHRFQVSDSESFATLVANEMGSTDAQGLVRLIVSTPLATGKKFYWRVRAESNDQWGPWSDVRTFTTVASTPTPTPTPTGPTAGKRTPDPAPGTRLPLPDMFGVLQQFSNASDSCPRGLKYINNPWQDRVIDRFRQDDTRWGYNAKPTRTAADNGGVPVVAAGDEAAYHYSAGPDEGSTDVHLVDLLVGHCGPTPTIGWRVFTGEEPGRWTGAGRF